MIEAKSAKDLNTNVKRGQYFQLFAVAIAAGLSGYFAFLGDIDNAAETAQITFAAIAALFAVNIVTKAVKRSSSDHS